jgi:transcriptional regulator with XRE-family HTH domain
MDFGTRLMRLRTTASITLAELALRSGINYASLLAYEKGHHAPGLAVLQRLAKGLNVSLAAFDDCKAPADARTRRGRKQDANR